MEELRETEKAIRRHGGTAAFLAQAAQCLHQQEHAVYDIRWDLSTLVYDYTSTGQVTWDIVSTSQEAWHGPQLALVQERLVAEPSVQTAWMDGSGASGGGGGGGGGHLLTVAQAPWMAQQIRASVARVQQQRRLRHANGDDATDQEEDYNNNNNNNESSLWNHGPAAPA
jgi:hypothetical protein